MRVSDNRDLRNFKLAAGMLAQEARTQTITRWTGLSADRVRTLLLWRRREGLQKAPRRPGGPSPTHLEAVLTTPSLRIEAAAVTFVCWTLQVIPAEPLANARTALPSVARGERLLSARELFQDLVPHARLTLEQWLLLLENLADGTEWGIVRCNGCPALVVADRLALASGLCEDCQHERRPKKAPTAKARESKKAKGTLLADGKADASGPEQLSLFDVKVDKDSRREQTQGGMVDRQQAHTADAKSQQ